jgi:hypothetical protein
VSAWRFILAAAALIAAVPCGIAAGAPVTNGADLACGICVAGFTWAAWPLLPRKRA